MPRSVDGCVDFGVGLRCLLGRDRCGYRHCASRLGQRQNPQQRDPFQYFNSLLKARRSFFVGQTARFVPKLKSTIVCNSEEFTNVSELPSGQRRVYEEGLAAILPGYITERVAQGEVRLQQRNKLLVTCASLVATTGYLW